MNARVLYIEDNPINVDLVRKMLHKLAYEVLNAEDAITGLDMAHQEKPDLILMDVNLPGISGIEATQRLKADPMLAHIPVIGLTADDTITTRRRMQSVGCDGFLLKPFRIAELHKVVGQFLRTGSTQPL